MNNLSLITFVTALFLSPLSWATNESHGGAPEDYDEVCQCVDPYNGVRKIPVVIRDFKDTHPDFENKHGTDRGIVSPILGDDGRPVYAYPNGRTPTTHGKANFDQWFSNVPGVNKAISKQLEMREIYPGFWEYSNSDFFPINNEGFGNQGRHKNFHFTLETHLKFFYVEGGSFSFKGDDDLWIFINGKLAIDLGGVHSVQEKVVYLDDYADELGIEPGNTYSFDLFFAERHTTESNFKFQTTFELQCL